MNPKWDIEHTDWPFNHSHGQMQTLICGDVRISVAEVIEMAGCKFVEAQVATCKDELKNWSDS